MTEQSGTFITAENPSNASSKHQMTHVPSRATWFVFPSPPPLPVAYLGSYGPQSKNIYLQLPSGNIKKDNVIYSVIHCGSVSPKLVLECRLLAKYFYKCGIFIVRGNGIVLFLVVGNVFIVIDKDKLHLLTIIGHYKLHYFIFVMMKCTIDNGKVHYFYRYR